MINRKIDSKIEGFYKNHKKALLLTGARQVGKTSAIEKYASEHYDYLLELNFVTTPQAIGFLDGASDAKEMLFRITAISNVPMIPGKTLIFFDKSCRRTLVTSVVS